MTIVTTTSTGDHVIRVEADTPKSIDGNKQVWSWNMTAHPDFLQHVSTEIIRALCQHVFMVEAERDKERRRIATFERKEARMTTDYSKRLDDLERAIARVRVLHRRDDAGFCHECGTEQWPCRTLLALASDPPEHEHPIYLGGLMVTPGELAKIKAEAAAELQTVGDPIPKVEGGE